MLEVEFAQRTDTGKVREHNEDCLGSIAPTSAREARTHGWLFALADGVGGQDCGEIASQGAIDALLSGFRAARAGELLPALMTRLFQAANSRVVELAMSTRGGVNMATTLVACVLRFDRVVVGHAGDSRCYLIRKGRAQPLTRDHTLAGEHLRMGILSGREAASAETKHLLTRSLGSNLGIHADVSEHLLAPGDMLMLCSDGLHGAVDAEDFARILTPTRDLELGVRDLINMANENGGHDNISLVAIRVRALERVGMYRGRPYQIR